MGRKNTLPTFYSHEQPYQTTLSPDAVKGGSIQAVYETYGTEGLFVRTIDTLVRIGAYDSYTAIEGLRIGLEVERTRRRIVGHAVDHVLWTTLELIETLGVTDPITIASMGSHDTVENNPHKLVQMHYTDYDIQPSINAHQLSIEAARSGAYEYLARTIDPEAAAIVRAVTNPIVMPGEDTQDAYVAHFEKYTLPHLAAVPVKTADVLHNWRGDLAANHPDKQHKRDIKYSRIIDNLIKAIESHPDINEPHRSATLEQLHRRKREAHERILAYKCIHSVML